MEKLISEVQKRNLLWIQKHSHQKDRVIIDKEWDDVAERTGFSKSEAKKKWRNLRDQFLKEFKRIPRDKTTDAYSIIASYPGKWQYFGDLIFLKDAAMTRRARYASLIEALEGSQNNDSKAENGVSDENSPEEAGSNSDSNTDTDVPQPSLSETKMLAVLPQSTTEVPSSSMGKVSMVSSTPIAKVKISRRLGKKKRRRGEGNVEDERMLSDAEAKRPSLGAASEDENSLFLRSLLPYFKRLGPVQQLRVRTKFQEVLLEAMTQTQQWNSCC